MRRVLLLIALCLGVIVSNAQTQADPDKDAVRYDVLGSVQYQMLDFDAVKNSSYYGFATYATSLIHWNSFHIGANVVCSVNYGIADSVFETTMVDFGPSARVDISKSCFINIPVNACLIGDDDWYGKISPALHMFPNGGKIGIFVGPQLIFDSNISEFGMVAGLTYSF